MTIFKEVEEEELLTLAEAKALLSEVEVDRAAEGDELRYELARAIDHVNRFAVLDLDESEELVAELRELEKVDEATAYKVANLLPRNRTELRAIYAQERYALDGDELDEILDVVAKYA